MNASPPLGTILCHLWFQIPPFHILIHTFLSGLSSPSSANLSLHPRLPTCRHPVCSIHALHMTKPPQSTSTHHLQHTLNTQPHDQLLTLYSIGQGHTTHPSHHRPLRAL